MSVATSFSAYDSHSIANATITASVPNDNDFTSKALPDLILVANAAGAANILLPKIGSNFCPPGTRVTIRKNDTGAASVSVTPFGTDTIDGNANLGVLALPASNKNSVTLQALTASTWITVDSSIVGI